MSGSLRLVVFVLAGLNSAMAGSTVASTTDDVCSVLATGRSLGACRLTTSLRSDGSRPDESNAIIAGDTLDGLNLRENQDQIAYLLDEEANEQPLIPAPVGPVRKLADGFRFTEGPAYAGDGIWYFSDLPNKTLHRWSEGEGVELIRTGVDGFSNGVVIDEQGRLIFCEVATRRIMRRSPDGTEEVLADQCDGLPIGMPNDLLLAPNGAVYFTIPKTNKKRARVVLANAVNGTVCMISSDGSSVRDVGLKLTSPNGIVGSSDGRFLYVADPGAQSCWRYTIEPDGTLSNQQMAADRGSDGLAVDEYGNLYVTARDEGIAVFDRNAKRIATIPVPERPANMKFGGPDNRTLFITARTSIYAVQMNVRGG